MMASAIRGAPLRWEYCEIIHSNPGIVVIYYTGKGTNEHKLIFDNTMSRDYEQWKREPGRYWITKDNYLEQRQISKLLAEGWEWWQRMAGIKLFRRQVEAD
jgi:hypothetical protein